jgi:hypothetical protein
MSPSLASETSFDLLGVLNQFSTNWSSITFSTSRLLRDWLVFDQRNRGPVALLTKKPRFGQAASALALADPPSLHGDTQVVADTATNWTSDVFKHVHRKSPAE